jgi:L-fuconolactonase
MSSAYDEGMRLDAHVGAAPDWLGPILKRNRFDGCVLVGSETGAEHEFVRAMAARLDLADPRLGYRLDELQRDPKFKGVVHEHTLPEPRGARELARRGLTLDLLLEPEQLPLIPRLAEAVPELRIVIDHVARPEFENELAAAAAAPAVYGKISGLISGPGWNTDLLRPHVRHALDIFGPDRLMFGSGWPFASKDCIWKEGLSAFTQSVGALPLVIREKLLGGTAARFYSLAANSESHHA